LPEQCSAKAQSSFLTRQQAGQFPLSQSNEAQNSNNYSVDAKTDDLMQRVIREKFSKHTIIAVAHKLDTILDFDKVALLDRGILVEFDNPYDLLEQPESAFYQFYHSTRAEMDEDNCDNVSTSSSQ
jgi:ABC-type multidrug transport system ATPase subunit